MEEKAGNTASNKSFLRLLVLEWHLMPVPWMERVAVQSGCGLHVKLAGIVQN